MNDVNSVVMVGRLTRDSELKYTNSGTAILNFSLANNVYQGKDKDEYVNFFDCQMWGKSAEKLQQYLTKGTQLVCEGSLRQERWDSENGKRSKVKINVRNIQLVGGKRENNNQDRTDNFEDDPIPF